MKRSLLSILLMSVLLVACPRPLPGPDGGTTPTSVMSVLEDINGVLTTVLPVAIVFFERFIPAGPTKAIVIQSAQVVVRVGNDWQRIATTYRERGGDVCGLYATSGALTDALVSLARALTQTGFGWGEEIEHLIRALGLLTDRLIGRCQVDGVDAGALSWSGTVGDRAAEQLQMFQDQARSRGVPLRPLPALNADSLR